MLEAVKKFLAYFGYPYIPKKEEEPVLEDFNPQKIDDIIRMGMYAEELLKNPAFIHAFNSYRKNLEGVWSNSKPLDTEGREAVWFEMKALFALHGYFKGMVNNMKAEAERLKALKEAAAKNS